MSAEQDAYTTLRSLVPIARVILDLEEVFELGLGLKSTIAALESRKQSLAIEVADLLKQMDALRSKRNQLMETR